VLLRSKIHLSVSVPQAAVEMIPTGISILLPSRILIIPWVRRCDLGFNIKRGGEEEKGSVPRGHRGSAPRLPQV